MNVRNGWIADIRRYIALCMSKVVANLIWPQTVRSETSIEIRAGRAAHWFFLGGVILLPIIGFELSRGDPNQASTMTFFGFGALVSALFGRGVRYILANE